MREQWNREAEAAICRGERLSYAQWQRVCAGRWREICERVRVVMRGVRGASMYLMHTGQGPDKDRTEQLSNYRSPSRTPDRSHEKITNRGGRLRYVLRGAKWVGRFIPFLRSQKMPSPSAREIPNIDFTIIPEHLQGSWVVVRLGANQEVLASADSPEAAVRLSGVDQSSHLFALTQVPEVPTAARMQRSDT